MKPNTRPEVLKFVNTLLEVADKNPPKPTGTAAEPEEQQALPQRDGEDIVDFNNRRLRYIKQHEQPAAAND